MATTYHWNAGAGGSFNAQNDWLPVGVPGSLDTAIIDFAGSYVVTSGQNNTVAALGMHAGTTLDVTAGTFAITSGSAAGGLAGTIVVANGTTLSVAGTLANSGTIDLQGFNTSTALLLAGNTTLTGSGLIQLNDNGNNLITSANTTAPFTLDNAGNTIAGSGQLGGGALALVNGATGTIDANNGSNSLTISVGAAGSMKNYGLVESTAAGALYLTGTTVVQKTAGVTGVGTIEGAGYTVVLNTATIDGGTLLTTGGGTVETAGATTDALNGGTAAGAVTVTGSLDVSNNSTLDLLGTILNKGTIDLLGFNGATVLQLGATVTLTGGGLVQLNDNGNNAIYAASATAPQTLDNTNNVVAGSGQLGDGQLTIVNAATGTIDANNGGNSLTISTGAQGSVTNAGLIESTASGGLVIAGTVVNDTAVVGGVTTDVGTITASGSVVTLTDTGSGATFLATTIKGGTLVSTAGGTIESANGATVTLDGSGATTTIDGTLHVVNNSTVDLLGTIALNAALGGGISIDGYNGATLLQVDAGAVTLNGGGTVTLADNGHSQIAGAAATDKLVNAGDTIAGGGSIGNGSLSIDNQAGGVIDATGGNRLYVDTAGGTFTNEGLIEATAQSGLQIYGGTTLTNTGTLSANGANVYLDGVTIIGGTLATPNGVIDIEGGNTATLNGATSAITLAGPGTFEIANGATADVLGSLVNQGDVFIDGYNTATQFVVASATLTLTGTGTVSMQDNGNTEIVGLAAADKLINVNNTIVGGGYIGIGSLSLDNQAAGTIDATGGNRLDIDTAGGSFTNEGLIEATANAGLQIYGGTTLTNAGTLLANGANIYLDDVTIIGGTLATPNGVIAIEGGNTATLNGATSAITLTGPGTFEIENGATADVLGSLVNGGDLFIDGYNTATQFVVASATLTLTGAGTVSMQDNGYTEVLGLSSADKLINVNNTIVGGGSIGIGSMSLDNQAAGTIDATGGNRLYVDTAGGAFTNEGLIEATANAGLEIYGGTTLTNTGTLLAGGANIYLDDATVIGGTLATPNGVIAIESGNTATLNGATSAITLTGPGTFEIENGATADVLGSLVNAGDLFIDGYNTATQFVVASATLTLTGAGTVSMQDNGNTEIVGLAAADKLVNVNNTIVGGGYIGIGSMSLDNQAAGIIDATGGNRLDIDTGRGTFTNEGLIEATANAGLEVYGGTTLTNAGTLLANGADIYVDDATIKGGTLAALSGGFFVEGGNSSALNGVTLTDAGGFTIDNGATADLLGTITNASTIAINGYNTTTSLIVDAASVKLTGGGTVAMANNGNTVVTGAAGADKLINFNNAIVGGGQLGNGRLLLDNQAAGVIDGNTGTTLTIALSGAFTNEGTVEDTGGGGGVMVQATTLTNTGTLSANGGNVAVQAGTVVSNLSGSTLTGGTWAAYGGATLSIATGGPVVTDASTIVLSGAGSAVTFGGTAIDASLTTIAAHETLEVLAGRIFTAAHAITDSGLLRLGGGTVATAGVLSVAAGADLAGNGVVTTAVAHAGLLDAQGGGTLALTGAVTGAGAIEADAGTVLQLNQTAIATLTGTATLNGSGSDIQFGNTSPFTTIESSLTAIASGGTLNVLGARGYTSAGSLSVAGVFNIGGGAFSFAGLSLTGTGTLSGFGSVAGIVGSAGKIVSTGGLLDLGGGLSGAGKVQINAGSTLELAAGSASGAATVSGVLLLGATTYAASALTVAATGTVEGGGTLSGAVTLSGSIVADSGLLKVASGVKGTTGTLIADAGATLELGTTSAAAVLSDAGVVKLDGGTLTAASLTVASGATLTGVGMVASAIANSGQVTASGGVLTLAGGAAGTGTLLAATGATLALTGGTLAAGSITIATGAALSGKGTVSGPVANGGAIKATGGLLSVLGTVTGSGTMQISNAATLEVGASSAETVTFAKGAVAALQLDAPATFTGAIGGLALGDVLDLRGVLATNATVTKGVLQVTESNGGPLSFKVSGALTGNVFAISTDNNGGSLLTLTAASAQQLAVLGQRTMLADMVPAALSAATAPAPTPLVGGSALYVPAAPLPTLLHTH